MVRQAATAVQGISMMVVYLVTCESLRFWALVGFGWSVSAGVSTVSSILGESLPKFISPVLEIKWVIH